MPGPHQPVRHRSATPQESAGAETTLTSPSSPLTALTAPRGPEAGVVAQTTIPRESLLNARSWRDQAIHVEGSSYLFDPRQMKPLLLMAGISVTSAAGIFGTVGALLGASPASLSVFGAAGAVVGAAFCVPLASSLPRKWEIKNAGTVPAQKLIAELEASFNNGTTREHLESIAARMADSLRSTLPRKSALKLVTSLEAILPLCSEEGRRTAYEKLFHGDLSIDSQRNLAPFKASLRLLSGYIRMLPGLPPETQMAAAAAIAGSSWCRGLRNTITAAEVARTLTRQSTPPLTPESSRTLRHWATSTLVPS